MHGNSNIFSAVSESARPLIAAPAGLSGHTAAVVSAGVMRGWIDRKAPGKPPTLTAEQRAALALVVEAGPEP